MVGSDRFRFLVFLKRVSISSLVCFVGFVVVVVEVVGCVVSSSSRAICDTNAEDGELS